MNGRVSSFYTLKFAVFACTFGTLWHFLSIKMLHFRQYCVDCLGYTDMKGSVCCNAVGTHKRNYTTMYLHKCVCAFCREVVVSCAMNVVGC